MARILLLLCFLAGLAWGESYEDRLAQTDIDDPDQRYELAMWCKQRKMHRTAHKHFKAVLDTNPDHVPTRREMGYIRIEDEWVHLSRVPANMRPGNRAEDGTDAESGDGGGEIPLSTGPGPKASDIEWDLTLPREPEGLQRYATHVDRYISKLERESTMWDAIATLMLPEHREVAAYRLAHRTREGSSGLTYGIAMFMIELRRKGGPRGVQMAEDLVPFLVASARNESNPDALYAFCTTVGQYGEKKAVPRLIQLLDHPNEDVVDGARTAIQAITFLAYDEIDADSAQAWWDRYHAASDALIYGQALEDDNPEARLNACKRLYQSQDKRIVPVLADLVADENVNLAFASAISSPRSPDRTGGSPVKSRSTGGRRSREISSSGGKTNARRSSSSSFAISRWIQARPRPHASARPSRPGSRTSTTSTSRPPTEPADSS